MDRRGLADRIVVYSDTVVAFALVNGFAFLVALGEPDIRCSIAKIAPVVATLNLAVWVGCTFALVWLRRTEQALRDGEEEDEMVADFSRIMRRLRMLLVWTFAVLVLAGIYAATFDERCLGMTG